MKVVLCVLCVWGLVGCETYQDLKAPYDVEPLQPVLGHQWEDADDGQ